ncbi:MAG: hypothetical protein KF683_15160 [Rubrivivax sp.]|nr:hypothetical protein [Rubrivivax sp.]
MIRTARRRACLAALAAALTGATLPAFAQSAAAPAAAAAPIARVGVFSLLGDAVDVTQPADVTDTRIERKSRESLVVSGSGFDQAALRGAAAAFSAQRPQAQLFNFRATQVLSTADQRTLADGARRAELPGWIVGAIGPNRLSHLLIITRTRGDSAFPVLEGYTIGRVGVEGIGFYLDNSTDMINVDTGRSSRGFLGPHALVRLQLMDAVSGDMVAQQDLRDYRTITGRRDEDLNNPWNSLAPDEKVTVLRDMLQQGVQRVLTQMLESAGKS